MKIVTTAPFDKDYVALPEQIQDLMNRKALLMAGNPRHPSLRIKKMEGHHDIWEASISMSYRFTFQRGGDTLILRRVGTHDILRTP